jgi:coproporphyrinogen III oxidase
MQAFSRHFESLQHEIVRVLQEAEQGRNFTWKHWKGEAPLFGNGASALLQGKLFEKAAINTSTVSGRISTALEREMKMRGKKYPKGSLYNATGISLIVHPMNPFIPTVHSNCRYFEIHSENGKLLDRWIGGVMDLSPSYVFPDDCRDFHQVLFDLCNSFPSVADYWLFKRQADEYFFLGHRKEWRGIGGIFFDDLEIEESNFDSVFAFAQALGKAFEPAFIPIVKRRASIEWSLEREKKWQQTRRSRYVEFNLLFDRGTKFGLESGGIAENVLVSMPLEARWEFAELTQWKGKEEIESEQVFKERPKDWLNEYKMPL